MSDVARWRLVVVAVVTVTVLAAAVSVPTGAAGPASTTGPPAQVDDQPSLRSFADNNTTTQHDDPERVGEDGDLGSVKSWLASGLASQLDGSALQLSQSEYEQARGLLGDDFGTDLGKYVDVAGETDTGTDDRVGRAFERTRTRQQSLVDSVQEYRETREAYREARAAGDEERARRLARELGTIADEVNATNAELQESYRFLENQTSVNLTTASTEVANVTSNITSTQTAIEGDVFVATRLNVSARSSSVSYLQPLVLDGTLRTADGEALGNRTVRFGVGNRTLTARTDSDGRFTVRYRPVSLPVSAERVTLRYRPRPDSVYLGSSSNVPLSVTQVVGSISVDELPSSVAFGDSLSVSGRLSVAGEPIANAPVAVSLGGRTLATTTTDADGEYTVSTPVPAGIPNGSRVVRVGVPLEDTAVVANDTRETVTITRTSTRLTVSADQADDGTALSGRLVTADGTPVPEQVIQLRVDGSTLTTVTSGTDGRFRTTLTFPASLRSDDPTEATLTAIFRAPDSNLVGSRTETDLTIPPLRAPGGAGDGGDSGVDAAYSLPVSLPVVVGGVLLVIVAIGAVVLFRRRSGRSDDVTVDPSSTSGDGESNTEAATEPAAPTYDSAETLLSENPDLAVQTAYWALRTDLSEEFDTGSGLTHWEFVTDVEAAGLNGERGDSLRDVTAVYEQSAFAGTGVDAEKATDTVAAARAIADE